MNCLESQSSVREIEDIIDIQKASGSFNARQEEQILREEPLLDMTSAAMDVSSEIFKKKSKKKGFGSKYKKRHLELVCWPSDSDITVLRLNHRGYSSGSRDICKSILGDGLHLPESSSMVNLATIITDSLDSLKKNEVLLPLTSWDPARETMLKKPFIHETYIVVPKDRHATVTECKGKQHPVECRVRTRQSASNSTIVSLKYTRSKVARFLRLYFCPCCTCLYEMEARCEQGGRSCAEDDQLQCPHIDY